MSSKLKQNGEQPLAVSVEISLIHNHHVEDMGASLFHKRIPSSYIFRCHILKYVSCLMELVRMESMVIMRIDGLYEIPTFGGENHIVLGKQWFQLLSAENAVETIAGKAFAQ